MAKDPDITTGVESFNPDAALELLTNPGNKNRPRSDRISDTYAATMARGAWRLNGEPIIIDKNGCLIDGQHRLEAVTKCGKTLSFVVVRGVDPDAFGTIDVGFIRKPAHYLGMLGERNTSALAALLRLVARWEGGWDPQDKFNRLDNDVLEGLLRRHPATRVSVGTMQSYAKGYPFRGRVSGSLFGFIHYAALVTTDDPAKADEFVEGVMRGVSLGARDPRYVLRQHFLVGSIELGVGDVYLLGRIVHGWNLWSAGKSCQYLRVDGIPEVAGEAEMWKQLKVKGALERNRMSLEQRATSAGGVDRTDETILGALGASRAGLTVVELEDATGLGAANLRFRMERLRGSGLIEMARAGSGKAGGASYRYTLVSKNGKR